MHNPPLEYCREFKEYTGLSFNCCDSCHDEFLEGYAEPFEIDVVDSSEHRCFLVCCGAIRAWEDSEPDAPTALA